MSKIDLNGPVAAAAISSATALVLFEAAKPKSGAAELDPGELADLACDVAIQILRRVSAVQSRSEAGPKPKK
jgi:hypothetical protein